MKVHLRNPSRTEQLDGPTTVLRLLERLDLNRESVLVLRAGELVTGDVTLADDDEIEIRPVISGGAT